MNNVKKVGFVSIVGMPNVGKSSLFNLLFDQKLSIVSPKAQTTRFALRAIYNDDDAQIIFIDTPGIIRKESYLMHKKMMEQLSKASDAADILITILDATKANEEAISYLNEWIKKGKPYLVLFNKIDLLKKTELEKKIIALQDLGFEHILPFSTRQKKLKKDLIEYLKSVLPQGPVYYDNEDQLSDRSTRFFCGELIREQLYFFLHDELPYETTAFVYQFQEKENITVIYANIVVGKESQKPIVIGKDGKKINSIGRAARKNIEDFLQQKVYLDLKVKVRKDWKKKENFLKEYGFAE